MTVDLTDIVERLLRLSESDDHEHAHGVADNLLIEALERLGHPELSKPFDDLVKWYA